MAIRKDINQTRSNKTTLSILKHHFKKNIFILGLLLLFSQFAASQAPAISNLVLRATSADVLTEDSLYYTYSDNGSVAEVASTWYKNGNPESTLYLPFEGGATDALLDYSGNNNDAYTDIGLDSIPTWSSSVGHNGNGGYLFDGGDHLHAGDIFPTSASYTKAAWVNLTGGGFRNIISSVTYDFDNHTFFVDTMGILCAGHNFGFHNIKDTDSLFLDQWYFVALTFDYGSGEMILYKDGVEVANVIIPIGHKDVVDPSVLIGALNYHWEWEGSIDDPRIYDRVLTAEQIRTLHTTGSHVIAAQETASLDEWYVEVTPFSTSQVGSTYTSNTLTIHSIVISGIPDQSVQEGSTFSTFDLDDYVTDSEYSISELDWEAIGNSALSVYISSSTNVVSITIPDDDWYGSEEISFIATNPQDDADTAAVTFSVLNVNDAPLLTSIGDQDTDEEITLTGLSVVFSDPDAVDTHTITVDSDNSNVTMENLSGHNSSSTYHLVTATDWNGTAQITVEVTDNGTGALSDSETYTLTVDPVNDAPVLVVVDQDTNEDTPLTGVTVVFSDPDALDVHTFAVASNEDNVTVENLSGNTYDLVPAGDWNGIAQITLTVTDNGTLSDTETYTLTVNPINDAPVIAPIVTQNTPEDITYAGVVVFTDPDAADTHTLTVVSGEANVSFANIIGQTYDLVPAPNWTGSAQITVTVTDNGSGALADSEVFTLEVHATNDAPVLTEVGPQIIDEDNSEVGLAVVYSDNDATDAHIVTVVSSESGVTVTNLNGNASGSTYDLVPDDDWNGVAQITVTVEDDGPGTLTDVETFALTVNAINDVPTAIVLSNNAVEEGVAIGTVVGVISSTDPDIPDSHSYQFIFEGGTEEVDNHFFTIIGNELRVGVELDYELKNSFSLLLQTNDGHGGTFTQQLAVTVTNVVETGIGDENESLSFKVYPVPAVERVTIEIDNPENVELHLEIYSNAGSLVHSEHTVNGNTIDLGKFARGMYILRIQGEGIFETRKIIVRD